MRLAVAGRGLVDGVVDELPHEVEQAVVAGAADVHAGALADGVEALEDLDGVGVVARLGGLCRRGGMRWPWVLRVTTAPRRWRGPSAVVGVGADEVALGGPQREGHGVRIGLEALPSAV